MSAKIYLFPVDDGDPDEFSACVDESGQRYDYSVEVGPNDDTITLADSVGRRMPIDIDRMDEVVFALYKVAGFDTRLFFSPVNGQPTEGQAPPHEDMSSMDEKTTSDVDEYIAKWGSLMDGAASVLGCVGVGFDPMIGLECKGLHFQIPPTVAERIVELG